MGRTYRFGDMELQHLTPDSRKARVPSNVRNCIAHGAPP